MDNQGSTSLPWGQFLSEFIGTAILLLLGFPGDCDVRCRQPIASVLPDMRLRMIVSGFLFGAIGGSIALSQVGKSAAHINPVVTMGFWLMGKIRPASPWVRGGTTSGGIVGCVPLLAWGAMGRSIGLRRDGAGRRIQHYHAFWAR